MESQELVDTFSHQKILVPLENSKDKVWKVLNLINHSEHDISFSGLKVHLESLFTNTCELGHHASLRRPFKSLHSVTNKRASPLNKCPAAATGYTFPVYSYTLFYITEFSQHVIWKPFVWRLMIFCGSEISKVFKVKDYKFGSYCQRLFE